MRTDEKLWRTAGRRRNKVLARGTRHVVNRAVTALRLGASTLLRSQTYLGAPLSVADARGGTGIAAAVPPAVATLTKREKVERKEMWVDSHYCWVVLCKNHWFHLRQNIFFRHRIPLAETDPVSPRPSLEGRFRVRCDDCRKEYFYKPSEVLKYEQELSDSFTPHPLFRDC